uniref:AsIV-cont00083-ORF2 n=1 Tax=Apophua simplicipes ichnovirus TaxID=1329648 RepID=S5DT32_9VIRU|nr:AsIV-cont00083-ORF2 [Apophua simplicipes ichnovirus]
MQNVTTVALAQSYRSAQYDDLTTVSRPPTTHALEATPTYICAKDRRKWASCNLHSLKATSLLVTTGKMNVQYKDEKKKRNTIERTWKRLTETLSHQHSSTELVMSFWRISLLIFTVGALTFLILWKIPKDILISEMVSP